MNPPITPFALGGIALLILCLLPDAKVDPPPAPPNTLTIAAQALKTLTAQPEINATPAYMPPTAAAMLAPFENLTFTSAIDTAEFYGTTATSEVLLIEGMDSNAYGQMKRPEKPEQIKVTLHTQDGRDWTAKWEEKK